jgi:diguanylate cyclase (GGDEF)-like protein
MLAMDAGAIEDAAAASAAKYRSFAEASRTVLDLLERHLPHSTPFLAHLDRGQGIHRIVDCRNGRAFGLRSNLAQPLRGTFCDAMAEERGPRLCNDVPTHPVYGALEAQVRFSAGSYLGVPLELADGSRVGSLAALARVSGRFSSEDERLLTLLARVLASELERESNQRDLRRLNDTLRGQARRLGALTGVAQALASSGDARPAVCRAACDAAGAPVAFLLEPSGADFVSTAMHGAELTPVTIQPRADAAASGRAAGFTSRKSYFVPDARSHPALAEALVKATDARSALFEPVLRGDQLAGVLIVIWRTPMEEPNEALADVLRLIATQAAAAIEQEVLRARAGALALTDRLTGLASRRIWDEELPRELARARRYDAPLSIAVLDLDHMSAFNMLYGEAEGDRLLKESGALWRAQLREVDLLARLEDEEFGLVLPNCGLGEGIDVVDRVRAATPRGQTVSAGIARWDGEEPVELLVARAAEALAGAKAGGRDMTIAAE